MARQRSREKYSGVDYSLTPLVDFAVPMKESELMLSLECPKLVIDFSVRVIKDDATPLYKDA